MKDNQISAIATLAMFASMVDSKSKEYLPSQLS
jgi:hypothetical protein